MFEMIVAALAGVGASGLEKGAYCTAALAVSPGMHCAENPGGVALSADKARATELALYGLAGESRFRIHFGREVPVYALIDFDGKTKVGEHQRALNRAGFRRTLPWLSRQAYADALRAATRQMVDGMAAAQKLPDAEKAKLLEQEMSTAERGLSRFEMDLFEATVVPHEIGHGWYTETFWPAFVMDKQGHYGSPSPDWLDETAAILMESGDSADLRRHHFREAYLGRDPQVDSRELLDLRQFLERDHPEKEANQSAADSDKSAGVTVIVGARERPEGLRSGARYYEQGRVFADFLVDKSGDRAIFGSIGKAFGEGRSMEQWLAASGPSHNLADSVAGLQKQWTDWLVARFGPARPRPE